MGLIRVEPLRSLSSLAEGIKENLGPAGRGVHIEVVPAPSDSPQFYRWCGEQLLAAIREAFQERDSCRIAIGGGKSTFRMVRNITHEDCEDLRWKNIWVYPATSGVEPPRPHLSALVVAALLWAKFLPEEVEDISTYPREDEDISTYQTLVSDPYNRERNWDIRGNVKDKIDILVSGIGHNQYSYCAGLTELASDPGTETAGEFLFHPFDLRGSYVPPTKYRVDCAPGEGRMPADTLADERVRTFYSLFSLRELMDVGAAQTHRPLVIGIGTNINVSDKEGASLAREASQGQATPHSVSKVQAVLGALRGGFIRRLIIPMDLAEELYQQLRERKPSNT